MTHETHPSALPSGRSLHWYELRDVIGQGGFGITYLAHDNNLDRPVAIKEFMPAEVVLRDGDTVMPRTQAHRERYRSGLDGFIEEARTLARFDHASIVRVHSVFEANGTAYMVMRFEQGENLATLLERRGVLPEAELLRIVLPILEGLQLIHGSGFIHRDIKPENIYIRGDGSPVLLDFGSARQSTASSRTITALVAPGYAPLEQYYGEAKSQGPWTDIYGLAATCYRAITGEAPRDAIARAKGILGSSRETLVPASIAGHGRYSEGLLAAVDHALQLNEADRPQHVDAWRSELVGLSPRVSGQMPVVDQVQSLPEANLPPRIDLAPASLPAPLHARAPSPAIGKRSRMPMLAAIAAITVLAIAAKLLWPAAAATDVAVQPVATEPAATLPVEQAPAELPAPAASIASIDTQAVPAANGKPAAAVPAATVTLKPATPVVAAPDRRPATALATAPASTPPPTSVATDNETARAAAPGAAATDSALQAAQAAARRGDYATVRRIAEPLGRAGDPKAQILLGTAQENGEAGVRSNMGAYIWYSLAAARGEASAATMRDRVAGKLQSAELRQADELVAHWQPVTGQ